MSVKTFVYEIISIDDSILRHIRERLTEGEELIKTANEKQFTSEHLAWVKSFSSVIDILDPKGESFSGSLASRWYSARWFAGNYPKNNYELSIVFGQYLAVAQSLLLGKAKIVKERQETISTNSIFHKRDLPVHENFVFVLMPFQENWSDYIWGKQIKPIVEGISEFPLICKRADDLFGHDVMRDIYESILSASIVIADITNRNANVFYELGIAHSFGKDVILLSQGIEHIPFDLNRYRHCIYSNDGMGYEVLADYIPKAVKEIFAARNQRDQR